MSGVAIVLAKLLAHAPLTAVVASSRIAPGDLPEETSLPAIRITQVSSVPRVPVRPSASREFTTDRVQVDVIAKNYPQLAQVMRLVRQACPNTRGTVAGFTVDSILPDTEGPDGTDDQLGALSRSRDFIVRWATA